MKITIEPTPEMYSAPINGQLIPLRVWRGQRDDGAELEAYVLSIVPTNMSGEDFARGLPPFMVRSREQYKIDLSRRRRIAVRRIAVRLIASVVMMVLAAAFILLALQ